MGAGISTYISQFFSGGVDPSGPHFWLISLTVVGGVFVAAGIICEEWRAGHLWSLTTMLVVLGIVIEAGATIVLFEFDEGISRAQQDRIIALSARPWSKDQFDAIQELKGTAVKDVAVLSESHCIECLLFASHLELAFHEAGMTLYRDFAPDQSWSEWAGTGIVLWIPAGFDLEKNPMRVALRKAGLNPFGLPIERAAAPWPFKANVWVVQVGERFPIVLGFPFQPTGAVGWKYESLRK